MWSIEQTKVKISFKPFLLLSAMLYICNLPAGPEKFPQPECQDPLWWIWHQDIMPYSYTEEKLRWMFRYFSWVMSDNIDCECDLSRLYDEDDSGVIDLAEMTKISTYLYHIDGVSEVKTEVAHW